MSNSSKRFIVLLVLIYLLIVSVVLLNFYPAEHIISPALVQAAAEALEANNNTTPDDPLSERLELMFSHSEHFYDTDIEVSIFASIPEAVIHYTLDSSEPTTDSPVYESPISLKAAEVVEDGGVFPLKAIAVYNDEITRPLVHTYFVAKGVHNRFDLLVIALSTNDEYLYDYDTGILVEGVTRANYREANPRAWIEPPAPANFNWRGMESERFIYTEMFEPDGRRVIAQGAGVRVHGGWSRAEEYKSLRIAARRMYEPGEGNFEYDLFPDDTAADMFNTPITEYDQLILSNNANDRNFAMLRQEVNYALAKQAGLRVVSPVRGAAVFVNGEYYGFAWLLVRINEQYLEDVYNAPTREFQIASRGEWWITTEDEATVEAINYFNSFYEKDFTDDKVLAEFEKIADIDNLLLYYAYQTYVGNRDWPGGNLRRWRYIGEQTEGLAPELDGRWRYLTFDLDFTLSLYEDPTRPDNPAFAETLARNNPRFSHMLAALFVRPEMVDKYAMYVCDIAANIVNPQNVREQTDRLYGEMYHELGFAFETKKYASWVGRDSVEHNHANMIEYAEKRPDYFIEGMREYFEWDDGMFTVEVSGGDAIIGTQAGTSSTYFTHLNIPLRPNLQKFTLFDHWVLNGKRIDTPEITVSIADAKDGVVRVELVTVDAPPSLLIQEAYGSSERNGAVLYNASNETLKTTGLYLTNDLSNPQLWAMPLATLAPGETLELAGRSSRDSADVHRLHMNFNVREGRMLYLCNEDGEVLDWMAGVPSLSE